MPNLRVEKGASAALFSMQGGCELGRKPFASVCCMGEGNRQPSAALQCSLGMHEVGEAACCCTAYWGGSRGLKDQGQLPLYSASSFTQCWLSSFCLYPREQGTFPQVSRAGLKGPATVLLEPTAVASAHIS